MVRAKIKIKQVYSTTRTQNRLIRLNIKDIVSLDTNMNDRIHVGRAQKLRGKNAIYDIHRELSHSDENTINFKISEIYSVSLEEADEIHVNYHLDRIILALKERTEKSDLTESDIADRLDHIDIQQYANEVSKGFLLERAAIDSLFDQILPSEKNLNFYG